MEVMFVFNICWFEVLQSHFRRNSCWEMHSPFTYLFIILRICNSKINVQFFQNTYKIFVLVLYFLSCLCNDLCDSTTSAEDLNAGKWAVVWTMFFLWVHVWAVMHYVWAFVHICLICVSVSVCVWGCLSQLHWLIPAAHCRIWVSHVHTDKNNPCKTVTHAHFPLNVDYLQPELMKRFHCSGFCQKHPHLNKCFCLSGWMQLQTGPNQHHLLEGKQLLQTQNIIRTIRNKKNVSLSSFISWIIF